MRRFFRSNKKGFTLIELLIVVGILGILAGVVTLGVSQFIGKGKAEAATTELHNVQTAVTALMSENSLGAFPAVGTVDPTDTEISAAGCIAPAATAPACDIAAYLVTALHGDYDVAVNGLVIQTAYP